MPDTASPLEIAYTAVMVIGLLVSAVNLAWHEARLKELRRARQNGMLLVMRRGQRNDQAYLVVVLFGLVVIGINSMLIPPNPELQSAAAWVTALAFMIVSLTITALSITIRIRPRQLRDAAPDLFKGETS